MKKVYLTTALFIVTVLSCKSSRNNNFTFKNGNKVIELQVPQNQILLDGETTAKLKLTNINPKELAIVGVGVMIKNMDENECNLLIRTRSGFYENKKEFELHVYYKKNGERIKHTFYIPFKKSVKTNLNP